MPDDREPALIQAAQRGDEGAFRALAAPLRRELHVFCYRMLGGFHDAEDALQEAQLKAWRGLAAYDPRGSFRAWLYKIASNTCLDMLRTRRRRVLPAECGPPVAPGPPATERRDDIAWLEPYPDALLPAASDPAAAVRLRESIRLAFVRAMQLLPARQRAALILHDVLEWPVAEVAAMLDTTVAAVSSALQRARATLAETDPDAGDHPGKLEARRAEAVARYVAAWETGDMARFASLLARDAILSMPPWIYWLDGRDEIVASLQDEGTWGGAPRPGRYRMVPAAFNGSPAAVAYLRDDASGAYNLVCMTVMALDRAGLVSELTIFVLHELLAGWGLPATLAA